MNSGNRFLLVTNKVLFFVNILVCCDTILHDDYTMASIYFMCALLNINGIHSIQKNNVGAV